jgi:2-dehydropantoate 2-reductase
MAFYLRWVEASIPARRPGDRASRGMAAAAQPEPLAAMFERAEIPCRISDAIEAELWTKIVINCAYNAISAVTRARYGRIARFEPVRVLMRRAIAETVAVARAEGVSSTAQDIARGVPTEIDSLNGSRGAEPHGESRHR